MNFKTLVPIFIVVAVDILGYTIILPLLPFAAEKFGGTPFQVGLLVASFAFCQFLAGPLLGRLSDRWGRKPILLISQFGTFISFVMLGSAQSLVWVFAARILDGITAGNLVVAQACISDLTPPKDRARAFGVIGIAFGLGFFIGPMISGVFAGGGFKIPSLIAAGFSAISIGFSALLLKETHPLAARAQKSASGESRFISQTFKTLNPLPIRELMTLARRPGLGSAFVRFFLFNFAFSGLIVGLPLVLERTVTWNGHAFGSTEVGWFYAYLGLLGIFVQTVVLRRVIQSYGEQKVARSAAFLQGSGVAAYALVSRSPFALPYSLIASTVANVGSGLVRPALTAILTQLADPKAQGQVLGVSQSIASVATIAAPLIAGVLIDHHLIWGWALIFGLAGLSGGLIRLPAPAAP